jgi:hypothetical protein
MSSIKHTADQDPLHAVVDPSEAYEMAHRSRRQEGLTSLHLNLAKAAKALIDSGTPGARVDYRRHINTANATRRNADLIAERAAKNYEETSEIEDAV